MPARRLLAHGLALTVTAAVSAAPAAAGAASSPTLAHPLTTHRSPETVAAVAAAGGTGVLPSSSPAVTALAGLPVKGRAPRAGYDRSAFGQAWTDDTTMSGGHNGCDTRNDVLRRDLTGTVLKHGTNGCVVLSGTLTDPYGGTVIDFVRGPSTSSRVQIDHVVSVAATVGSI